MKGWISVDKYGIGYNRYIQTLSFISKEQIVSTKAISHPLIWDTDWEMHRLIGKKNSIKSRIGDIQYKLSAVNSQFSV